MLHGLRDEGMDKGLRNEARILEIEHHVSVLLKSGHDSFLAKLLRPVAVVRLSTEVPLRWRPRGVRLRTRALGRSSTRALVLAAGVITGCDSVSLRRRASCPQVLSSGDDH